MGAGGSPRSAAGVGLPADKQDGTAEGVRAGKDTGEYGGEQQN